MSEEEKKAQQESGPADAEKDEKQKAAETTPIAEAGQTAAQQSVEAADPEKAAKLKAAAEARAARAAAKAAAETAEAAEASAPPPPSPKQPELDAVTALIRREVADEALEDAYINELNGHMPTLIVKNEYWRSIAELLKIENDFTYLRNVSGVDYETHLEVVYHLVSLRSGRELAVKIKADREKPEVSSATPVWATANWNEREIYDLLGIVFPGHPDLRRIMMPDDWAGHPLRKDYEPLDSEV
ncbi:NADH-quinone oxidoreductase subunit C [Paenibacillus gorillae]|uniref:NADH-quinone oxidoreductase subunit C n=1 Tax=Paenibacillus gorillae TaxID=1243662 RepID=UPI0004BBC8F2|nr:NADH-quinone oxidoreductase subunit C [Paenibacillus gorillae]